MKYVITLAALFFLFWTIMNKASKRGKLNEGANKAVKSLATTMRYFIIGLIVLGLIAFIFVFFTHQN
ncbi:hypothetical protein [Massilia soli]|uniref:Uncharacterized protein n=1 Tax=Massilia soli TaxID=2792854 RepID=A0ABS7SLD3_9BURK|nr:hypothetical protein [Massilia soli]MBZ2206996.1 hypothetical protein [Massilia soli]